MIGWKWLFERRRPRSFDIYVSPMGGDERIYVTTVTAADAASARFLAAKEITLTQSEVDSLVAVRV